MLASARSPVTSLTLALTVTVTALLAKFGDRVKHVHRDFPIARLHPEAPRAHVAARCANEQGKFWAYHDKVFAGQARSSAEQLKTYAREVGLDAAAFEQCLGSNKYEAIVQKDIEDGSRLGVTGTPTFFINGRPLVGAQPLAKFVEIIEDELARKPQSLRRTDGPDQPVDLAGQRVERDRLGQDGGDGNRRRDLGRDLLREGVAEP
jgi:DSBA-like thioredoxin domain